MTKHIGVTQGFRVTVKADAGRWLNSTTHRRNQAGHTQFSGLLALMQTHGQRTAMK